jgi:hypothetical protein
LGYSGGGQGMTFSASQILKIRRFYAVLFILQEQRFEKTAIRALNLVNNPGTEERETAINTAINGFTKRSLEQQIETFAALVEYKNSKDPFKAIKFSPMKLSLTPVECRFALDEMIGSADWVH